MPSVGGRIGRSISTGSRAPKLQRRVPHHHPRHARACAADARRSRWHSMNMSRRGSQLRCVTTMCRPTARARCSREPSVQPVLACRPIPTRARLHPPPSPMLRDGSPSSPPPATSSRPRSITNRPSSRSRGWLSPRSATCASSTSSKATTYVASGLNTCCGKSANCSKRWRASTRRPSVHPHRPGACWRRASPNCLSTWTTTSCARTHPRRAMPT